ncbi:hypothetical protein COBT_004223, partial [Conglomerata obtusa]
FLREFGCFGCYTTLDGASETFCDWRIRPISITFDDLICSDINNLIDDLRYHVIKVDEDTRRNNYIETRDISVVD